jgi:lysophospholipase L1-like esterase
MRTVLFALGLLTVTAAAQTPAGSPAAQQSGGSPVASAPLPSCPELGRGLTALVAADPRNRDWANVARYREANKTVKDAQVVFMGDSITDNWQQPRFGGFFPGKAYVDRGISGQTTPQMLVRFPTDVINLKPKVVVILAGTNDIAGNTGPLTNEEIENNLAAMSALAHANSIKVVLSSITPVSAYHATTGLAQTTQRPVTRILAVNDWMKKYAASHGDVYLDYYSAMIDTSGLLKSDLSGDDLHPTTPGYAIMAPLAEAAIQKALK